MRLDFRGRSQPLLNFALLQCAMEPLDHFEPRANAERQEPPEDEIRPLPIKFQPENGNAAGANAADWQYFNLLSLGTLIFVSFICPN